LTADMVRLAEHAGKALFAKFGIPVPEGYVVRSLGEIRETTKPMAAKAQVLAGGRGKAGGILFGSNQEQLERAVTSLLSMRIGGEKVSEVLIEERLNIIDEYYVSISVDRSAGIPMLMVIPHGGTEVETTESQNILKWNIHPFIDLPEYVCRECANQLILGPQQATHLEQVLTSLWRLFWAMDCDLAEINPLVKTGLGDLIAADAKVTIDDDALFRHPELPRESGERTPLELEARDLGLSMVQLDGGVGVVANGAGLTMATLDNLALHGSSGGVFLDLGGTDDEKVVEGALSLLSRASQRVILVNIFGGITKCDTVAEGIVAARKRLDITTPIVARIRGVNEDRARSILAADGIMAFEDLDDACKEAARLEGA